MTSASLFATPKPAGDPMTGIRINRALSQPGAKGKKGFLLWTAAAFPKPIADKVMAAALQHVDPGMRRAAMSAAGPASLPDRAGPSITKMGRFGGFGEDANLITIGVDVPGMSDSTQAAINATDSSAASPDWLSSISNAINLAGQAYLTKTQVDAAGKIFDQNLYNAQHGLPMIKTNPTAYGLPAPTVNFGLAGGTQSALLWVAGGLGIIALIASVSKHARKR